MGRVMQIAAFSLAEVTYAVGGDIGYQVQESAKSARFRVRTKQENVSGVFLPAFESYTTEGNNDFGLTGLGKGGQQVQRCRETYARAGLDPTNKSDRCQYFEAHGTGTLAGDPQEAEALSKAFFDHKNTDPNDILYVGSVKTIIGHTEGTAGVAGILKACMALKHATIPTNLHFNHLSPNVAPFYKNLRILSSPQPWPSLPDGVPRRVSVNSFGRFDC